MSEDKKKEETTPESTDAKATEVTKPKSNLISYIIYAVSGLVLIGGIAFGVAFMLKDSPKADAEQSAEVADSAHVEKKSEEHASNKYASKDEHATQENNSHAVETKRDDNLEISKEDFYDAGDEEFDSKAIEKIVDNLVTLEYKPTDSELREEDNSSVEDSLAQMSWIEKEKLAIETRKKELDIREKELNKIEKSVDSKIIRIEQAESSRTSQLAKLYDGMDSRAVAKLMMNLDDNTVVAILPRMKSKNAALVLQILPSKRAAALSKQMITIADK